jgi:osmotically-inducible protein OsmY
MQSEIELSVCTKSTSYLCTVDAVVGERTKQALQRTGYLRLNTIEVSVHESLVTLKGQVASYYLKQIAQTAAMSVNGVGGIENNIVVDPNGGARLSRDDGFGPFREDHIRE